MIPRFWARLLALAVLAVAFLAPVPQARAQDLIADLVGQPAQFVQALRDTFGREFITVTMADVSSAATEYVISPITGTITAIYVVVDTALTTANTKLTTKLNHVDVTNGVVTLDFSDETTGAQWGAGLAWAAYPTALNSVNEGTVISIASDGGSTNTSVATITIIIDRD